MIAEIGAGLSSLKAALELAKGLSAVANQAALNDVRIELQGHILAAQEALSAARDADASSAQRIHKLEEEVVRLKDWKAEKQNYQLKGIAEEGASAYVLKPGIGSGEAPHWLCTTCFDKSQKSILQPNRNITGNGPALKVWRCNSCAAELMIFWNYSPHRPWVSPSERAKRPD